jgi:hypothetical protein
MFILGRSEKSVFNEEWPPSTRSQVGIPPKINLVNEVAIAIRGQLAIGTDFQCAEFGFRIYGEGEQGYVYRAEGKG